MRRIGTIKHLMQNGQLEVVADDVLNIVRKIHADFSERITVYWNDYIGKFTITETSLDGSTERLIFNVKELDERVLDRLREADQWRGREDPEHILPEAIDFLSRVEKKQEANDAEKDETFREKQKELKEQFVAYAELDGQGIRAQILVPRSLDG